VCLVANTIMSEISLFTPQTAKGDTLSHPGRRRRVHARVFEDLDQLAAEGRNVLFDFVDVVLGDALVVRFSLFDRHVAPHQVPHDALHVRQTPSWTTSKEMTQKTRSASGRLLRDFFHVSRISLKRKREIGELEGRRTQK
jgi:hypothetical protein